MNRRRFGNWIESRVCDYLIQRKFQIIDRNYYTQLGEIDIIAQEAGQIVFVEVRSCKSGEGVSVYELLPDAKIRKLAATIDYWLQAQNKYNCDWRFDFVGVVVDQWRHISEITHLRNVEL